jgi:hypothetical protein
VSEFLRFPCVYLILLYNEALLRIVKKNTEEVAA